MCWCAMGLVFIKEQVFLRIKQWGFTSLLVFFLGVCGGADAQELFLRVLVFSCFVGVVFIFGCVGVKSTVVMWGLFLMGVVFCSIVGGVLFFMREGAKHMGMSWLWCSNDFVFYVLFGFTFPFVYEGVRCVRIVSAWFLEKGFFLGSSR